MKKVHDDNALFRRLVFKLKNYTVEELEKALLKSILPRKHFYLGVFWGIRRHLDDMCDAGILRERDGRYSVQGYKKVTTFVKVG